MAGDDEIDRRPGRGVTTAGERARLPRGQRSPHPVVMQRPVALVRTRCQSPLRVAVRPGAAGAVGDGRVLLSRTTTTVTGTTTAIRMATARHAHTPFGARAGFGSRNPLGGTGSWCALWLTSVIFFLPSMCTNTRRDGPNELMQAQPDSEIVSVLMHRPPAQAARSLPSKGPVTALSRRIGLPWQPTLEDNIGPVRQALEDEIVLVSESLSTVPSMHDGANVGDDEKFLRVHDDDESTL